MKAHFEHLRKEAKSKLPPVPPQEPLIKVRRNRHPPFFGEALQYIQKLHKKHSANDLYGLQKACQESLDLALTCPDVEHIIQKWSDLGMKTRFQHIGKARVLGFEVGPDTDIDIANLPFSFEDV
ncbi:hypothetical protein ACFX14_018966 [Malus domestica]